VGSYNLGFTYVLSGAGNISWGNNGYLYISANVANPITLSGTISDTGLFHLVTVSNTCDFNLRGFTTMEIEYNHSGGYTLTLTSALTTGTTYSNITIASGSILNTGNYNINERTGNFTINGGIICGSSTMTTKTVTIGAAGYITGNTSSWTCTINWTNASTSALWSAGTATINFNGTAAQTLGLNNGNNASIKYYNIVLSGAHVATDITWGTNTITILGSLSCTATFTTGKITCATNNPSFAITGGFTLANGSTWLKGTGTTTFNGTQAVTDNNATKQDLGICAVSGAVTVTFAGARFTRLTSDNAGSHILFTANSQVTTGGYIDMLAGGDMDGTAGVTITSTA
jgi:hypothetical protein